MYACSLQEPEFVIELLKYVKDINVCDYRKQTVSFLIESITIFSYKYTI